MPVLVAPAIQRVPIFDRSRHCSLHQLSLLRSYRSIFAGKHREIRPSPCAATLHPFPISVERLFDLSAARSSVKMFWS